MTVQHRSTAALAVCLLALAAVPRVEAADRVLELRAFAVNLSGGPRARAGTIDINIERWSSDEERNRLRDVLIERGSEKLLAALQDVKPRVGYVRTSTSLGWDLSFARETPLPDGGRRIVLASDRPMSFWELRSRPRSTDYEFMLVEIRLDAQGKGQGKLARAAKVDYDKASNTIQIENYGIEPVRLTQVEVVGPGKK
jgi:hypothetical protein